MRAEVTTVAGANSAVKFVARLGMVLAALAVAASASAGPANCTVLHDYLGNDPDTDSPDWSEDAQGIANDGHYWFFTRNKGGGLYKYDPNWVAVNGGHDIGNLLNVKIPPVLATNYGINHFGDPDAFGGYVFVPFEGEFMGEAQTVVAVFRASDLVLVDYADVIAYQPKLGWLAIDPVARTLYASDGYLDAHSHLLRYAIDVSKVENGVLGDFLQGPPTHVPVLEKDGSPLAKKFVWMQGGVFSPWGDLYISVGKADDSPSNTRGGLHLLRPISDGTAFQLIESSVNVSDHVGDGVFAYEYHPGDLIPAEEPEGIDWWNRDNVPGSKYSGQLHAILLDNDLTDDQIWLKHYRVDYSECVGAADSDGDGLLDVGEAYVFGTHPLIADTDMDGQSDGDEFNCSSDPLDRTSLSPDFDGNGIPDCVDTDDDNDGQLDVDELACGSNPLDPASLSPDADGDHIPDCVDHDDDGDGVADANDACPLESPALGLDADNDGCTDTTDGLSAIVSALDLKSNVKNGLLAKITDAEKAIDDGNIRVATNKLLDFIKQVEGQRGKSLTDAQADLLVAYATNILSLL